MTEPLLQVDNLSVTFPQRGADVRAVRGISYDVRPGEFLGIVGESGSGKSVSSLAVMGLLPSTARIDGSIRFKGRSLLDLDDKALSALRGSEISMIFQDPLSALTPVYSIGAQLIDALTLHQRSLKPAAARARAVELLELVGIPSPQRRMESFPHEFSGGMRQRVMIAMAIANDPELIIADEPTTALDVTIQAQILDLLQKARELTGAAVVLITHDLGVVAGNADRIAVMYAGRLVEAGPVDDVFYRPRMPYTMGLLRSVPNLLTAGATRLVPLDGRPPSLAALPPGCPFQPRCPVAVDECRSGEPELAPVNATDAGHAAACLRVAEIESGALPADRVFPRPEPLAEAEAEAAERPTVLAVDGLARHFPLLRGAVFKRPVGTVRAVDGVSFAIREGEVMALVGESGCGKTTTILEILELGAPQQGRIEVGGVDVSTLGARQRLAMRRDIQIVFQDPMAAIDPRLTVQDIIAEPLTVHRVTRQRQRERVAELLDLVGLDADMAGRYPHEFSGGQRQRIGIARALSTNPRIVVLDEPVSALDVSIQAGVINLLEDLRDRLGLSYLFVAHDLAVVRQIADTVAVMYLGRIVESGPIADVFHHPRHPYTQALLSAAPLPDPVAERSRSRILLTGDLPSPTDDISGCRFHGRCPLFRLLPENLQADCLTTDPAMRATGRTEAACHHIDKSELLTTPQ